MARTKDRLSAAELGMNLMDLLGNEHIADIHRAILERVGPHHAPAPSGLRLWYSGDVDPNTADLLAARAIAEHHGVTVETLHPILGARDHLLSQRYAATGTGPQSRWTPAFPDRRRHDRRERSICRESLAA